MTTLEYNGTEKSLADRGFEITASLTQTNQANDVFAAMMPTATISDTPIFPFEASIIVRNDGVVEFVGKRLRELIAASGSSVGVTYQFAGPWYDLEHTVYQQKTAGYNNATKMIEYVYQSQAIFYTTLNSSNVLVPCTNGQQIIDILQFLIDMYAMQTPPMAAPFQIGTIDPAINLPSYIAQPMMCAAAIEKCLELSPDCTCFFDYSTTPPTFHCRARANMPAITLPLFDGVSHKSVRIEPRPELIAKTVIVFYKSTNTSDGQSLVFYTKDKFGPNGANSAADPDGGLRVVIETVDLAGFQSTSVSGSLDVEPVAAIGGTQATKRTWWANVRGGEQQVLGDMKYRFMNFLNAATTIPDATITDELGNTANPATGNAWLLDFPNRVVDGAVHPWMTIIKPDQSVVPVTAKRLTVKMSVAVQQWDTPGTSETDTTTGRLIFSGPKDFVCHITLTNGVTSVYSAEASFVAGEDVPTGVAQAVYNSLAQLQYEGDYVRVQNLVNGAPTMGNVLCLSNGRAEWAGMNAQIQSVKKTYGQGYTEVSVGPAKHLNAGELASIFNAFRFRRVWYNRLARQSGAGGGGNTEINKNTPKSNTTPASENPADTTNATGPLATDATIENHTSVVKTLTTGVTPTEAPAHNPQNVQPIKTQFCNPDTGEKYFRVLLAGGSFV